MFDLVRTRVSLYAQFFLFNDILVYASTKTFSSKYSLHDSLPLESLSVRTYDRQIASEGKLYRFVPCFVLLFAMCA